MWAYIPIVGWALGVFFAFSASIPLWLLWNWLAPTYLAFLPKVYHNIPFFHVLGLMLMWSIVKHVIFPRFDVSAKAGRGD